jgi:hypothetical protein
MNDLVAPFDFAQGRLAPKDEFFSSLFSRCG